MQVCIHYSKQRERERERERVGEYNERERELLLHSCLSMLYIVCCDTSSFVQWARRMICGRCSREQAYSSKPCVCGQSFTGNITS